MVALLAVGAEYVVTVTSYLDKPSGILMENDDGFRVVSVALNPEVTFGKVPATPAAEEKLHEEAQRRSVLGNSVTAKVTVYPASIFTMAPA